MLSIVCERRSNRVENHKISKGLHHIELQTRQCKYFELPKYIKGNSEVTKRNAFENYFNLSHLSPNIWLHPELATLSDHIGMGYQNNTLYLQHLHNIPTKQLLSDLSLSEKTANTARLNQYSEMNTYDVITFSCLGMGALCTIILFLFWLHKKFNFGKCHKSSVLTIRCESAESDGHTKPQELQPLKDHHTKPQELHPLKKTDQESGRTRLCSLWQRLYKRLVLY